MVLEQTATPGGKMREVAVGDARIDSGPTVLTMRWVFDELFAAVGASLDDHLTLRPAEILARHAWSAEERLDLFADPQRSADTIGSFAGAAEAEGYLRFCAAAQEVYETLEAPFMRSENPSPLSLVRHSGLKGLGRLTRIRPFDSLWKVLGESFRDPRLRQLFGRYATYCGSSPFAAPATLMLVAHVEQAGVWLVEGGMYRVAEALEKLARKQGAVFRFGTSVREILIDHHGVAGIELADGERLEANAVIVNADAAAVAQGLFGKAVRPGAPKLPRMERSLSALTWSIHAQTSGFPLLRHSVFFSDDYKAEFDDLFGRQRLPQKPTVYVCAQDRDEDTTPDPEGPERLLCLVNAPATGDVHQFKDSEIAPCQESAFRLLQRCGLEVALRPETTKTTSPTEFERLFPGTGGALYGPATHGWRASFRRPAPRTRIPGLYLAGGSIHPGPGVPMAALSGRLAAQSLLTDIASTRPSRPAATSGGTSTPSAATDAAASRSSPSSAASSPPTTLGHADAAPATRRITVR